jgi:hypothetical protein
MTADTPQFESFDQMAATTAAALTQGQKATFDGRAAFEHVRALAADGTSIYAWHGQARDEFYWCIDKTLEFKPTLTLDAGQTAGNIQPYYAAGVEGTERQLGAWLADAMDCAAMTPMASPRFTMCRQIAAVALRAQPASRLARQHTADPHLLDVRIQNSIRRGFVDHGSGRDQRNPAGRAGRTSGVPLERGAARDPAHESVLPRRPRRLRTAFR